VSFPDDQADIGAVCPHLGLADDADSHATYATEAHRCYKLPNPTRIASGHQESYCLGANHPACPVYQGEGVPQQQRPAAVPPVAPPPVARAERQPLDPAAPAPRGQRRPPPQRQQRAPRAAAGTMGPRPRSGGISMPVATIGLFALAIALVALAFLIQRALSGGDGDEITPAESFQTTEAQRMTQTAQAGGGAQTQTPGAGTTETPGTGETPGATTTPDGEDPTTTPTGGNGGGTTYTVVSGDTCFAIAQEFDTTVQAIIDANDLDAECSLDIDQVLTIP
jgi:LysM repeat protein